MPINIIILGDICTQWGFSELFDSGDYQEVFNDIVPLFESSDYVVANLESPITQSEKKALLFTL